MGYTLKERVDPVMNRGIPVIQLGNLASRNLEPAGLRRFPIDGLADRYLVRAGDVLFKSRGESNTALALGKSFQEPALPISPLIVLRPRLEVVAPEYLEWVINQPSTQTFFDRRARGTSMRMVPRSCLDELDIQVPDLATQRLIVAADEMAEKEKALSMLLADKRRLLVSMMLEQRTKESPVRGRK